MQTLYNLYIAFMIVITALPVVHGGTPVPDAPDALPIPDSEYTVDLSDCIDWYYDEYDRLIAITQDSASVCYEYKTYAALGFVDKEGLRYYMPGTDNDWELAYLVADYYYGYDTYTYDNSYGCVYEDIDPYISLPSTLFSVAYSEAHEPTPVYGYHAVLIDEDGVFFAEAYTYDPDPEYGKQLRTATLERITSPEGSLISEQPNPDAPDGVFINKPDSVDIGGGFSFDSSASMNVYKWPIEGTDFSEHTIEYSEGSVIASYIPYEQFGASRESLKKNLPRSSVERAIAEYCYNIFSSYNTSVGNMSDPHMTDSGEFGEYAYVRWACRCTAGGTDSHEEYLIITGNDGFLVFSFCPVTDSMTPEESLEFFKKHLGSLYFNGEPVRLD